MSIHISSFLIYAIPIATPPEYNELFEDAHDGVERIFAGWMNTSECDLYGGVYASMKSIANSYGIENSAIRISDLPPPRPEWDHQLQAWLDYTGAQPEGEAGWFVIADGG